MIRKRPSHATVVAYLALFVALGGTTYAATNLPANSVGTRQLRTGAVTRKKLHKHSVGAVDVANRSLTGAQISNHSLTGTQIDASTLGQVPNAARATIAAHAGNADELGGSPASTYLPHCPGNLQAHKDLCYELGLRPPATFTAALTSCARFGLRLPTAGELALAFDALDSQQQTEWVAHFSFPPNKPAQGGLMDYSSTSVIGINAGLASNTYPYRCVTSPVQTNQ